MRAKVYGGNMRGTQAVFVNGRVCSVHGQRTMSHRPHVFCSWRVCGYDSNKHMYVELGLYGTKSVYVGRVR